MQQQKQFLLKAILRRIFVCTIGVEGGYVTLCTGDGQTDDDEKDE